MMSFAMQGKKWITLVCVTAGALAVAPFAWSQQAADTAPPAATVSSFDVVTKASGLKIRELAPGAGREVAYGQTVAVHYTGWIQNPDGSRGTKFDSSRDRGEPLEFLVGHGDVIKGWDEGVLGMKVGGKRRLVVPAALGYGAKGTANGSIPPFATLLFDIELMSIK